MPHQYDYMLCLPWVPLQEWFSMMVGFITEIIGVLVKSCVYSRIPELEKDMWGVMESLCSSKGFSLLLSSYYLQIYCSCDTVPESPAAHHLIRIVQRNITGDENQNSLEMRIVGDF